MPIKTYKPTGNARRGMTTYDMDEVTAKKPRVKSLLTIKKGTSGRNNSGRITVRHRGGGVRRYYRLVNHKLAPGVTANVEQIEYDPGRSSHIALIREVDNGTYHYIIAAKGMKPGHKIISDESAPIETGNRLRLSDIPIGSFVYGIEIYPGRGAQLVRSAGTGAQLVAREEEWAQVKLPSGEVRRIHATCRAHVGSVGNEQQQNVKLGSAGRKRRMGIRPSVRGKAMNPVDHPMGGGEGQTGPGRHPKTPWGRKAVGLKTRRRKSTTQYIVRSRHLGKRK
jgi:large subunit ribosomal protein L2